MATHGPGFAVICVEAILASPELEAFEVSAEMSVQWDSDTINPRPERS